MSAVRFIKKYYLCRVFRNEDRDKAERLLYRLRGNLFPYFIIPNTFKSLVSFSDGLMILPYQSRI